MPPEQLGLPSGEHDAQMKAGSAVQPVNILIAAVAIAILTNSPSIGLSHHYNIPLGWERWPYLLPMGSIALLSFLLCGRDLSLEQLNRARWPLAFLSAYLLWCAASVTWSVAPDVTAVRSLVTAGVSAFGVWFALCLPFKEQALAVFLAMTTLSLWSLALILLQPHNHQIYPPRQYPQWHTAVFGVFGNPNSLGPVAALSVLSAIAIWFLFPAWHVRLLTAVVGAIGITLTLWSQSMTADVSLGLCVLALGVVILLPAVRKVPGWVVGGSLVAASIGLWNVFFHNIARIAPAIGADVTLSSRRLIWRDVRSFIALRPWRGYGFFAFWDNPTYTAQTYQHLGSGYGSAHNAILEVALGLGQIGLTVYIAMVLVMVAGTARGLWSRTTPPTVAWFVMALFLITQNSMESFVIWHSYLWAFFVAAMVAPTRFWLPRILVDDRDHDVVAPSNSTDGPPLDQLAPSTWSADPLGARGELVEP